jgi:excisionase family DNA binding protein
LSATKKLTLEIPRGRLLELSEVADILNVKPRMVRRLLESGRLRKRKVGRLNRIHPDDLADFIDRDGQ